MNEAYDKLVEVIKELADESVDLETVIGALHILQIQCETTLRIKLVKELSDDTV